MAAQHRDGRFMWLVVTCRELGLVIKKPPATASGKDARPILEYNANTLRKALVNHSAG